MKKSEKTESTEKAMKETFTKMSEATKSLRWTAIFTAVLYILVGIAAIAIPEAMLMLIASVLGWASIIGGAVFIVLYLIRDTKENFFRNDFVYGLTAITVGIVILLNRELFIGLIPMLLGILIVVSGCIKLQSSIDMLRLKTGNWGAALVLAIINVIFGIILIRNPFEAQVTLFRMIGIGLLFSGVTDLITTIYFSGVYSQLEKAARDAEKAAETPDASFEEVSKEKKEK